MCHIRTQSRILIVRASYWYSGSPAINDRAILLQRALQCTSQRAYGSSIETDLLGTVNVHRSLKESSDVKQLMSYWHSGLTSPRMEPRI